MEGMTTNDSDPSDLDAATGDRVTYGQADQTLAPPADPGTAEVLPPAIAPDLVPATTATPIPDDRHPALVYLARLAPGSRRTMRTALDTMASLLTGGQLDAISMPWHLLRYQHTAAVRAILLERYAPATANKHLAALRGVLKEAWRLSLLDSEEYHRAVDLPGVKGSTLPKGRALTAAELRSLFESCADGTAIGARDGAALALLYGGGLRRSEAVAVDLADYDGGTGAVAVRMGKGRKERLAYLPAGGRAAVEAWLQVRGDDPGPLLCPVRKGGTVEVRGMSAQALMLALRSRRRKAPGVASFSPHDLRRTFIGDLLDAGADLAAVQRLAGHAQVQTTARYDRRPEEVKRKAAELLQVPFVEVERSSEGADGG